MTYSHSTALGFVCSAITMIASCASTTGSRPVENAQARTCTGLPAGTPEVAMTALRPDIERVDPLYESPCCKAPKIRPVGATVYLHATPGLTAEWIGRMLQCDADRFASGAACPGNTCVMSVEGARASVESLPAGFAIQVRAGNTDAAKEILRRARMLVTDTGSDGVAKAPAPTDAALAVSTR